MTIDQAIRTTQKKKPGVTARMSVRYAQSLLLPNEDVTAAVTADIYTKREKFPGIAIITNQRVIAACGLPGIKRLIAFPLEDIKNCEETSSIIQYKAVFYTRRESFAVTLDPKSGEAFSEHIARLNGTDMDSVKLKVTGSVKTPTFLRQKARNQAYKEQAKSREQANSIDLLKKGAARFDSADSESDT